jgi:hypothetical protein
MSEDFQRNKVRTRVDVSEIQQKLKKLRTSSVDEEEEIENESDEIENDDSEGNESNDVQNVLVDIFNDDSDEMSIVDEEEEIENESDEIENDDLEGNESNGDAVDESGGVKTKCKAKRYLSDKNCQLFTVIMNHLDQSVKNFRDDSKIGLKKLQILEASYMKSKKKLIKTYGIKSSDPVDPVLAVAIVTNIKDFNTKGILFSFFLLLRLQILINDWLINCQFLFVY